jgi:predicted transcriptional regulator/DNA-binding XRE family transcriptional regulator
MAARKARMGAKLKALRRARELTQAQLAAKLNVSASYLNLIENDKRPLTAELLIALAEKLDVDVQSFASSEDSRVQNELMEIFADPLFDDEPIKAQDVSELVTAQPTIAQAIARLYRTYASVRQGAEALASRVVLADSEAPFAASPSVLPSEEVSDLLQRHKNYFSSLEDAADELRRAARIEEESFFARLVDFLRKNHEIEVEIARGDAGRKALRRYDVDAKKITISELLPPRSRNFQLAHQIALLHHRDLLDEVALDRSLTNDESRALCRVALANYFAAAVVMPYRAFLDAARGERYDIELLGHRFRTSYEQICHRMTTLSRPGEEGIPLHLIRVDVAGNISKRFSGSGIRFARYAGACPRWNVFSAFSTPGVINVQVSQMTDGVRYFCLARTVRANAGGYATPVATYAIGLGCNVRHAHEMVYADGVDLERDDADVKVGVTCRLCDRLDCAQRAFPPLSQPLKIDENARGLSFYAPATVKT